MPQKNELAPICLFTYTRLEQTIETIEALKTNFLATQSDLIIYSDGAKNEKSAEAVQSVRDYLKQISGFASVRVYESDVNLGLAKSIMKGVGEVIKVYGKAIIVEDDIRTTPNFLDFMNQGLDFYAYNKKVLSVCGYSSPINISPTQDAYFTSRSSSWGWATWIDRWQVVDWEVSEYKQFKDDQIERKMFNKMGSDMSRMLDRQMAGKINSWAIRFCFHQFRQGLFSVHPQLSKVENIGFTGATASHTKEKYNRFRTNLDRTNRRDFKFPKDLVLEKRVIKQFTKPYSITQRVIYKILNKIF